MAPSLSLPPDEAHLWYVTDDGDGGTPADAARVDGWRALLTPEEWARKRRYMFEHSRRQFLLTRALVRTVLSRYAGVEPAAWRFRANEWGRPEIDTAALPRTSKADRAISALRFNLSNCDGMVACIVAVDREVGVDVEDLERRGRELPNASSFFAPAEVAALRALPAEQQRGRFFEYWTLKESYIKARGMGLAIPLDAFAFELRSGAAPRIAFAPRITDDPDSWQFNQFRPSPRHLLATAIRRPRGEEIKIISNSWTGDGP